MIKFTSCKTDSIKNISNILFNEYQYKITEYLSLVVDWNKVFSVQLSFMDHFNKPSLRFVKSDLISRAVEKYSKRKLIFVDEVGYDFIVPETCSDPEIQGTGYDGIKIELKSQLDLFGKKNNKTKNIKLDNTNGQSSEDKIYTKKFDYLLLLQPGLVGITSYEAIQPYIKCKPDGRTVQIPHDIIEFFAQTYEFKIDKKIKLNDRYEQMIEDSLNDIEKIYDTRLIQTYI